MRVLFRGGILACSGYGQALRDYLMALRHVEFDDFNVQSIVETDTAPMPKRYQPLLDHLVEDPDEEDYTHVVVHSDPARPAPERFIADVPEGVKKILITTWDVDRCHPYFAKQLDKNFDLIIVPSQFNVGVAIEAGIPAHKVLCIPHTYHPGWYDNLHFEKQMLPLKRPYTFYSIGSWTPRKNPLAGILAYLAEFNSEDDVCFKSITNGYCKDDILNLMYAGNVRQPPKLEIVNGWFVDEIREFHRQGDCYVTLSRGDAFGLTAYEATLAGNRVIATKWSGLREFLDEYPGTSYVPCFLTPTLLPTTKEQYDKEKVLQDYLGVAHGINYDTNWAEPDIAACRRLMRKAYEQRDRENHREGDYDEVLRDRFSYDAIGQQLWQALRSL